MTSGFRHPLARRAQVWTAKTKHGDERVLVIVTTLELDPESDRYRKRLVDRLTKAADDFVDQHKDVSGHMLVARPRDWAD